MQHGALAAIISLLLLAMLLGACTGVASGQESQVQRFTGFLENEEVVLRLKSAAESWSWMCRKGTLCSEGR